MHPTLPDEVVEPPEFKSALVARAGAYELGKRLRPLEGSATRYDRSDHMNKLLVIGGLAVGAALAARPLARRIGSFDMAKCIEAMPDTAPPKWMFTNITAIRQNTDRILEILETRLDE